MTREIFVVFLAVLVLSPLAAHARETEHFYSAEEAAQSELGKERLFGIPFYLKGQEHPSVKESLFEVETDQSRYWGPPGAGRRASRASSRVWGNPLVLAEGFKPNNPLSLMTSARWLRALVTWGETA